MIMTTVGWVLGTLSAIAIVAWIGRDVIKYWLYAQLMGSQDMHDWFSDVRQLAGVARSDARDAHNLASEAAGRFDSAQKRILTHEDAIHTIKEHARQLQHSATVSYEMAERSVKLSNEIQEHTLEKINSFERRLHEITERMEAEEG
ncbi:MAG: hypothetical protein GY906_13480 [bacterium]|nr:hypothetical protein [bacterium]